MSRTNSNQDSVNTGSVNTFGLYQMLKMSSTSLHVLSQTFSKIRESFVLQKFSNVFSSATFNS